MYILRIANCLSGGGRTGELPAPQVNMLPTDMYIHNTVQCLLHLQRADGAISWEGRPVACSFELFSHSADKNATPGLLLWESTEAPSSTHARRCIRVVSGTCTFPTLGSYNLRAQHIFRACVHGAGGQWKWKDGKGTHAIQY